MSHELFFNQSSHIILLSYVDISLSIKLKVGNALDHFSFTRGSIAQFQADNLQYVHTPVGNINNLPGNYITDRGYVKEFRINNLILKFKIDSNF